MTKPEVPAQEPQHDHDCGCAKCFVAAEGKYAWRIGRKVPINVYEGDRPVCQCQTALDAKKIVAAVNAAMRQVPTTPAPSQPMSAVRMDEMGVDDVAIDATMFRFERMDEQTFWLCAYRGDKRTTFTMWSQGGKLYCRKDDDELGTTDDSENPVIPERAPAPSQPAGAREPMDDINVCGNHTVTFSTQEYCYICHLDRQKQTAAKGAELKACWNQLCDIGFMFDVVTPENNLRLAEIVKHKKEAAERERDSLREANARTRSIIEALRGYMIKQQINEPYTIQELNRADAALKAGKDGQ